MNKVIPIRVVNVEGAELLQIMFLPSNVCNYKCSYCFPGSNYGDHRFPKNTDTVIKNFQLLLDQYKTKLGKTKFRIHLGGGEPTLWPGITKFCEALQQSHNVDFVLITNGSRTLNWWDQNSKYFNDVMISCHHEFSNVNHIIEVADLLFSRNIKGGVSVLMDASNWDKCVDIVEELKTSKVNWIIATKEIVSSPGRGMDIYSPEQLNYLEVSTKRLPDSSYLLKHIQSMTPYESLTMFSDDTVRPAKSNTYINSKWNNFKGWSCDVALESLVIKWDGTVAGSCQEIAFSTKFNMYSENFENEFKLDLGIKSIICSRAECVCPPETHISKRLIS
jgi:sulfatase maturation enzyme AslB (radical SAM superfamily)